jgi:DNA-binding NarL/FixJ family response regulator
VNSHRIILVDGSRFLREMLKRVLTKSPDLEVVAEVTNLEELPRVIQKTNAEWVICCLLPGSGIPVILERLIVKEFPDVRILGISMDGSRVKLEWIGLHQRFLDDSSLEELTDLLRSDELTDEASE